MSRRLDFFPSEEIKVLFRKLFSALSSTARSQCTAGSATMRASFRPSVLPFWTKNLGHHQISTRLDLNEEKVIKDEVNIFGILEKYRIIKIVIENTNPQV